MPIRHVGCQACERSQPPSQASKAENAAVNKEQRANGWDPYSDVPQPELRFRVQLPASVSPWELQVIAHGAGSLLCTWDTFRVEPGLALLSDISGVMNKWEFFLKDSFIWKAGLQRKGQMFCLLVHSPDCLNDENWARLKPWPVNAIQSPMRAAGAQALVPTPAAFLGQRNGLEVGQLGLGCMLLRCWCHRWWL